MNAVGLKYNGTQLHLDPDFSIDWEVEDDLLDFSKIGQAYSWTIEIPIKGNEGIFKFASDPAGTKNYFKNYDGFSITIDGNIWWSCNFLLNSVSDDGNYYEGVLTSIPNSITENLKVSIREIIDTIVPIDDYNKGSVPNPILDITLVNADTSLPIYFPLISFYGFNSLINESDTNIMPAFSIKYLLDLCLSKLGYTLIDNFSDVDKSFHKLITFSNETTNSSVDYDDGIILSNLVPDLTLLELMRTLFFFTGGSIEIENDQVRWNGLVRINQSKSLQIAERQGNKILTSKSDVNDISMIYDYDGLMRDDDLSKYGTYIGIFETLSDFIATAATDEYGLVKETNAYHGFYQLEGSSSYSDRLIKHNHAAYITGKKNTTEIKCPMKPVMKDKNVYFEVGGNWDIEDNGSGKVRISGQLSEISFSDLSTYYQVAIITKESTYDQSQYDLFSESKWLDILDYDTVSYEYLDLDLTYVAAIDSVTKIILRRPYNFYFPLIGDGLLAGSQFMRDQGYDNQSFTPRVALWLGVQETTDGNATVFSAETEHGLASPDPYYNKDSGMVKLCEISTAINLNQTESFIFFSWKPFSTFFNNTVAVILKSAHLSSSEIKKMIKKKIVQGTTVSFRFRKMKCTLTRNGIRNQEIEGYTL